MARRRTLRRACRAIAEPNMVVIAESTRKLLGNLFDLQDLGAKDLKGIGGPVRAWVALRPASVESRFEALHASGLTELVGREEELELLVRRWSKAKSGQGQVVLLSGEAGIGKSRLTARIDGTPRQRAAHAPALFLFTAAHRQRPLSDHQSDGACRRICARRHRAKRSSTNSTRCWRRPRPRSRTRRSLPRCCRCRTTDVIRRSN